MLHVVLAAVDAGGPDEFERFAARVAAGPVPWVVVGLAVVVGAWLVVLTRRHRAAPSWPLPPTTTRPGDLHPAVAAALVLDGGQPSGVAATLLDLARRGEVELVAEDDGALLWRDPMIAVRLRGDEPPSDPVDRAVWERLHDRADADGLVAGINVRAVVDKHWSVTLVVGDEVAARGWEDAGASNAKGVAAAVTALGFVVVVVAVVMAGASDDPLSLGAVAIAAASLVVGGFMAVDRISSLSPQGEDAARAWQAYCAGLADAVASDPARLDLPAVLPDLVALGLTKGCSSHLEEHAEVFDAYVADDATVADAFPWWDAIVRTTTATAASMSGDGGADDGD